MSVREIKELEDGIREVSVAEAEKVFDDWEKKDFESDDEEDEEEEVEEFSIGDTLLARAKARERWGERNLEDEIEEAEFVGDFSDDDFDDDERVSYGAMSGDSGSDFYGGNSAVVGNLYGGTPGKDLYGGVAGKNLYGTSSGVSGAYGVGNGKPPSSMYNDTSKGFDESSLYNGGVGGKKGGSSAVYKVEGVKKKKEGGRARKSGLESGVVGGRKKRARSVSMM